MKNEIKSWKMYVTHKSAAYATRARGTLKEYIHVASPFCREISSFLYSAGHADNNTRNKLHA